MAEQTLTDDDLSRYAEALSAGKRPTVYLIEAVPSLGLAAGSSAKVTEISGTTVTVKPAGVDDLLPYEARELRSTKKARPAARAAKPTSVGSRGARAATPAAATPGKRAPRAPRAVAVTVYVAADNTASVKVTENPQKPSGAREVALPAVHKALAGLGDPEARAAVEGVLAAARDAAAQRVAELAAELAEAKKSLASLDRAKRNAVSSGGSAR